jgi:hypothetical protein
VTDLAADQREDGTLTLMQGLEGGHAERRGVVGDEQDRARGHRSAAS